MRFALPATRRGRRWTVRAVAAACVLALAPRTWLCHRFRTGPDGRGRAGGAGRGGLRRRASGRRAVAVPGPPAGRGAALYRARKVRVILVTGDNSRTSYNEPGAMRAYLAAHGVPRSRVVLDYAGFDTWDSCARARRIFGVTRAVLVSQGFHIRRALALCTAAGIASYGIAVTERHDATWYYGGVRELAAAPKALLDVAVRPNPDLLGPREPGVAAALRAGAAGGVIRRAQVRTRAKKTTTARATGRPTISSGPIQGR